MALFIGNMGGITMSAEEFNKNKLRVLNTNIQIEVSKSEFKDLISFDPTIKNNEILIQACRNQNIPLIKLLFEHPNINVSARKYEILNIACHLKNLEMLELTLDKIKKQNLTLSFNEIFERLKIIFNNGWYDGFLCFIDQVDIESLSNINFIEETELIFKNSIQENLTKSEKTSYINMFESLLYRSSTIKNNNDMLCIVSRFLRYAIKYEQKDFILKIIQNDKFQDEFIIKTGIHAFINEKNDNDEIFNMLLNAAKANNKHINLSQENNYILRQANNNNLIKCVKIIMKDENVIKLLNESVEYKFLINHINELKKENEELKNNLKENKTINELKLESIEKIKKEAEVLNFNLLNNDIEQLKKEKEDLWYKYCRQIVLGNELKADLKNKNNGLYIEATTNKEFRLKIKDLESQLKQSNEKNDELKTKLLNIKEMMLNSTTN